MPRRRLSEEEKRRRWAAIAKAAMEHHQHFKERGLGVLIAKDAGVTPQSVSDWKNLTTAPEEPQLIRLAAVYGVSAEDLAGGKPGAPSASDPDEMFRLAAELTGAVTREVLPEGNVEQFLTIMEKAHDLLLEGKDEDAAYGVLFRLARDLKQGVKTESKD